MFFMENVRIYGEKPYSIAVIHGGPGAPGGMAAVANGLKSDFGVIEPLQSADSIDGQVEELHTQLKEFSPPFVLIGHSWGAWLAWMYAAKYPKMAEHIILVGSGPFEEKHTKDMMKIRLNNLDIDDMEEAKELIDIMKNRELTKDEFALFGKLMSKSDSYCLIENAYEEAPLPPEPHIFESVWPEAAELRRSGKLLGLVDKIKCKVTFIHGANDPHPYEGVQDVLNERGVDFEFILLDKCGHTPWKEKYKHVDFFKMIKILIDENR